MTISLANGTVLGYVHQVHSCAEIDGIKVLDQHEDTIFDIVAPNLQSWNVSVVKEFTVSSFDSGTSY